MQLIEKFTTPARAALLIGVTADAFAHKASRSHLQHVELISSLPTLTAAAVFNMKAPGRDKADDRNSQVLQAGASSFLQVDAGRSGDAVFAARARQARDRQFAEGQSHESRDHIPVDIQAKETIYD